MNIYVNHSTHEGTRNARHLIYCHAYGSSTLVAVTDFTGTKARGIWKTFQSAAPGFFQLLNTWAGKSVTGDVVYCSMEYLRRVKANTASAMVILSIRVEKYRLISTGQVRGRQIHEPLVGDLRDEPEITLTRTCPVKSGGYSKVQLKNSVIVWKLHLWACLNKATE